MIRFIQLEKSQRSSVLKRATDEYAKYVYNIAADIYDSCIKDFYYQYSPIVYDRHGFPSGRNLFSGFAFSYSDLFLDTKFDPYELSPYYNMKKTSSGQYIRGKMQSPDRRADVLGSVMTGIRAPQSSRTPAVARNGATFPMEWDTTYPNHFSKMYDWESSESTISDIFDDFCDNIIGDTIEKFYEILDKYV